MIRRNSSAAALPEISQPPAFLHDIRTTARLMSTTCWAVRELCRSGRLKFVRIGHRWLVSTDAIQRFIAEAEKGGRKDTVSAEQVQA